MAAGEREGGRVCGYVGQIYAPQKSARVLVSRFFRYLAKHRDLDSRCRHALSVLGSGGSKRGGSHADDGCNASSN